MDLRRSRRSNRMPAGLLANISAPRASAAAGWAGARMMFGRQRFRGTPRLPGGEPGDGAASGPSVPDARKRNPPLVSLLVGAVLILWLLLFLVGHH
jgi:hypothetical protein